MNRKRTCCVPNCKDQISPRHRFPNPNDPYNEKLFNTWLQLINNSKLTALTRHQIYKSYLICGRHFSQQCYVPKHLARRIFVYHV